MKNKNISRIIWGLALVIVGAIFALNTLGFTEINIFFAGWWTLFIIVPCFIGLFSNRGKFGNIIGLVIGVAFLLSAQGILEFALVLKLSIPIIIILIGLKMIFSSSFNRKKSEKFNELKNDSKSFNKETVAFSTKNINYDGQIFDGTVLDAVFGSINCHLRNAIIEQDCIITASAVFAGIDIKVPENVKVSIDSNALFGGVSDKRNISKDQNNQHDQTVTLYIEANCIFGGVNII
ncbi:MAG: LiaF transmembrane domain-containing protein [Saccharofermentanales bacterium]|jgi:predicted membrane protein